MGNAIGVHLVFISATRRSFTYTKTTANKFGCSDRAFSSLQGAYERSVMSTEPLLRVEESRVVTAV